MQIVKDIELLSLEIKEQTQQQYDNDKTLNDYNRAELEQMTQQFLRENDSLKSKNEYKYIDDNYLNKKMNREYKEIDDSLIAGYIENKGYEASNENGYLDLIEAIRRDATLNKRQKDNMVHEALKDAETSHIDALKLNKKTKDYYDPELNIGKHKKRLIQILNHWDELRERNTNSIAFNEYLDIDNALNNIDWNEEECFIIHSLYLGYNLNEIAKIMSYHPQNVSRKYTKIFNKINKFVNKM